MAKMISLFRTGGISWQIPEFTDSAEVSMATWSPKQAWNELYLHNFYRMVPVARSATGLAFDIAGGILRPEWTR